MKNIFFSILLTLSFIGNLFAQDLQVVPKTKLSLQSEKPAETFVMQYKDVEISIGDLKIRAPFLYQGEVTPKQGYIIDIRDTIRLKDVVEGCQSSCDVLVDEILKDCKRKISFCQENCDKRIAIITKENEELSLEINNLQDSLKSEKRSKVVWSIISGVAGAGLGILVYEIAR